LKAASLFYNRLIAVTETVAGLAPVPGILRPVLFLPSPYLHRQKPEM
jgi:hypothetical protein